MTTVRRTAGARAVERLQRRYPTLVLVHGPVHASWLNQIEIYFSIVQRKVLDAERLRFAGRRCDPALGRFSVIMKPWPDRSSGPSRGAT